MLMFFLIIKHFAQLIIQKKKTFTKTTSLERFLVRVFQSVWSLSVWAINCFRCVERKVMKNNETFNSETKHFRLFGGVQKLF